MKRFVTVGECMMELSQGEGRTLRQAYAGDMLNSAYYARRSLPADWSVDFVSGFGTDRVSTAMRAEIESLGIGTGSSASIPERNAGLYMIHLEGGERSFSYWRSTSAARLLARDPALLAQALEGADAVLFSGITLAILEGDGAAHLLQCLADLGSRGVTVAFDPNIRPNLWPDKARMRREIEKAAAVASVVLPSFADEQIHFGDGSQMDTVERYRALGPTVVALKDGEAGALIATPGAVIPVPAVHAATLVDTTGAGDSFNGIFMARLLLGDDPVAAASHAVAGAAAVIACHGAIVPDFTPPPPA